MAENKISNIEEGFEALLKKPAFNGLDYAVFLVGASKKLKDATVEQIIKEEGLR